MKIPTIHLNGTSPATLIEALNNAAQAIRRAEIALVETAPHMRDYYPQGHGAFEIAAQEHYQRQDRLQEVRSQLEYIWEQIANREGGDDG